VRERERERERERLSLCERESERELARNAQGGASVPRSARSDHVPVSERFCESHCLLCSGELPLWLRNREIDVRERESGRAGERERERKRERERGIERARERGRESEGESEKRIGWRRPAAVSSKRSRSRFGTLLV
jgi:hypothetical protein